MLSIFFIVLYSYNAESLANFKPSVVSVKSNFPSPCYVAHSYNLKASVFFKLPEIPPVIKEVI
jgi:hypothetical protein